MTQIISRQTKQTNYEEDNWDDIEIPETGLFLINNENDYELSTTTRDISEITICDSSDDDSENYLDEVTDYNNSKSTPISSSSINKVKEMMINSGVNKEEFSGLITRIGGENNKVIAVGDDWDNDIEIPEDGLANLTISTNKTSSSNITVTDDFEFDTLDEEQKVTDKNSITSPRELIIKQIEDPSKVFTKSNTMQSKKTLESFDDDFDFTGVDLDLSAKALKLCRQGSYEEEGNKDPFGSEKHSRNSSRLSILPSPAPTNGSQSAFESGEEDDESFDDIQFPERMESLTLISHNDDNDFENGLDIDDESVFDLDQLKNKNIITRPNPKQQRRSRRESFSIEFNTSPNDSRSSTPSIPLTNNKVHPKTTNNNSSQISSLDRLKTNKAFSKSLTSLRTSTTKNTTSTIPKNQISRPKSLQNPKDPKLPVSGLVKKPISLMKNTLERSISSPGVPTSTNKSSKRTVTCNPTPSFNKCTESTSKGLLPSKSNKRYQQNINFHNTCNNTPQTTSNLTTTSIPAIMRKPTRQRSFGDGTELDGFDDLPVNIDKEHPYTSSNYAIDDRKNSISSVGSKTDNSDNCQRRRKHKKNRKRMQPQLIKNLNADMNLKVVGEMVYNPITQRWDGNDSVLKDFDNVITTPIRPALISNMNNHATNTKSFQVVGKMKFDPIKMCWNNNSSDEEEEIWDCGDDWDDFISTPQALIDVDDNDILPANIKRTKSKHDVNSISDNSNDFQVGSEFDITSGFLAALLASERQHRNEITRWYPGALSKKNESRFGLRDVTLQRSYLYDLRNNNNRRNTNYSPSGNNSKINNNNRSGGLFEAAVNLTRRERRHFR
jgi:hypothetical protein